MWLPVEEGGGDPLCEGLSSPGAGHHTAGGHCDVEQQHQEAGTHQQLSKGCLETDC